MKVTKKKKITFFITSILIIQLILSSFTVSSSHFNQSSNGTSWLPESHLIEGVPYIGQTTACGYASLKMIFHYYGINITDQEIRYNSGVGFSFEYISEERLIAGGGDTSLFNADHEFLANLYGLSYEHWKAPASLSDEECWQEYWLRIKQNISNDIPVWTSAYPLFLDSMRRSFEEAYHIPEWIWDAIPNFLWNIITKRAGAAHAFVIVGYNESNQTLCFNDQGTEVLGYPEYGTYVWMNISDYKNAVNHIPKKNPVLYQMGIFRNIPAPRLNITAAFNLTIQRNVERMKGNKSAYDSSLGDLILGINALKALKKNLEPGIRNRLITTIIYKYKSPLKVYYKLGVFLNRFLPDIFNLSVLENTVSLYHRIANEKHGISKYLWDIQFLLNDTYLSDKCRRTSILLNQEAENLSELASYHNLFLIRGVSLSLSRGLIIIYRMNKVLGNVIKIEGEIINNLS